MKRGEQWLSWASELQSLAQAGLYYGKDKFDPGAVCPASGRLPRKW